MTREEVTRGLERAFMAVGYQELAARRKRRKRSPTLTSCADRGRAATTLSCLAERAGTMTNPKISPTADPRVRIAGYGARNWRTEVQDEPGADWVITGPCYLTKADALLMVDETVSRHFGEPAWSTVNALKAQVERLSAENAELQRKVYAEKRHNGALMVDADRRERRALALLPDCEAHRQELQYLRHCVSWYWHNMNDTEEARHGIVGMLGNTVLSLKDRPDYTVTAAELCGWLEKAIAAQNKPLRRTSYPTLADCLRSAHGDCDHDSACGDVIAEVVEALGLVLAEQPARCKPVKAARR